jgi:hypothetical protein
MVESMLWQSPLSRPLNEVDNPRVEQARMAHVHNAPAPGIHCEDRVIGAQVRKQERTSARSGLDRMLDTPLRRKACKRIQCRARECPRSVKIRRDFGNLASNLIQAGRLHRITLRIKPRCCGSTYHFAPFHVPFGNTVVTQAGRSAGGGMPPCQGLGRSRDAVQRL